jgi:hypothetical protein
MLWGPVPILYHDLVRPMHCSLYTHAWVDLLSRLLKSIVRLQEVENNREHLFGSLQTGYNPKVQYQALKTANWQQELPVKLQCSSIASKMDARTPFNLYEKDQEMPRKLPFF